MSEFIQGQVVLATDLISSDAAGLVPVDDSTNVLMVYKPDQTTATPTVVHGTTGAYSAQVTLDQAGWWQFVFTSTATGAGAGRARVYVSPVP